MLNFISKFFFRTKIQEKYNSFSRINNSRDNSFAVMYPREISSWIFVGISTNLKNTPTTFTRTRVKCYLLQFVRISSLNVKVIYKTLYIRRNTNSLNSVFSRNLRSLNAEFVLWNERKVSSITRKVSKETRLYTDRYMSLFLSVTNDIVKTVTKVIHWVTIHAKEQWHF